MTSDGPPGHFVQGFWSPVWWPCFGDRRHKCSSTEFASARRTVNPCIICQKPWTEEFWTVFNHRWGQIFFAWHLQQIQGLWCLFELAAFCKKPEDTETSLDCQAHGVWQWLFYAFDPCTNTPGLGPSTIYSLSINKLSHWRCGVPCQVWLPEETFFFSGCLDLMILCVFGPG